jgi:3-dehydroquinate dehydratase II
LASVIHVLNGPNLNTLGEREPAIYGRDTLADVEALCRAEADAAGYTLNFRQTNAEHEMVEWIQAARTGAAGVIINPAAFSYAGYPVLDALKLCDCPIVEVHISNIHRREEFRRHSYVSAVADGVIAGLGVEGYVLALQWMALRGVR